MLNNCEKCQFFGRVTNKEGEVGRGTCFIFLTEFNPGYVFGGYEQLSKCVGWKVDRGQMLDNCEKNNFRGYSWGWRMWGRVVWYFWQNSTLATRLVNMNMERTIVRNFFYPILHNPLFSSLFADQFVFRPTGSTTRALIKITHELTNMLVDYPYVHVISSDFPKAFDTVRHSSLVQKIVPFPIPNSVHNWFVHNLSGRSHCIKFHSTISNLLRINANIFQGSSIGPVSYVFDSSNLTPCCPGNRFDKYADDTYLLVPPSNYDKINIELNNTSVWATVNNLK